MVSVLHIESLASETFTQHELKRHRSLELARRALDLWSYEEHTHTCSHSATIWAPEELQLHLSVHTENTGTQELLLRVCPDRGLIWKLRSVCVYLGVVLRPEPQTEDSMRRLQSAPSRWSHLQIELPTHTRNTLSLPLLGNLMISFDTYIPVKTPFRNLYF